MARVLAVSCTHAPAMHKDFPRFMEKIWKQYRCNKLIHLGDLCNNASASFYPLNPSMPGPADEYKATKKQLKLITNRFPQATMIQGNHDALGPRKAEAMGILPEWLRDFHDLWGLPKGWEVHPRYSEIVVDNVRYMHGDSGRAGQFGAVKTAMSKFQSVVMGHLHSESGVWYYANSGQRIFGCNVGCGIDYHQMAFLYGQKFIKKPIVSLAVILDGFPIVIPLEL